VAALMIACMFVLTGGGFTARDEVTTEIVVKNVDCCEKAQLIIDTINGEEIISPRSITCFFLGHSLAQTLAIGIQHRVYASPPRCVETTYRVNYCTRSGCDYMTYTFLSERRIHCCS
jgi:hypothetical protein